MQDRYAGDENDFLKYAVLRRLHGLTSDQTEFRLGVCWYLTDPAVVDAANPQRDGEKVKYLLNNENWRRRVDAELFAGLDKLLVKEGSVDDQARSVANIQAAGIFPQDTLFFSEQVPQNLNARRQWHERSLATLADADIVFLDPDNSVSELFTDPVSGGKWASPQEARSYWSDSRSVMWISHPRQRRRSVHHAQTMATIQELDSLFCSVYLGHCGFHFLLCEQHGALRKVLRKLVRDGIDQNWGTCRYFDSLGESINPGAGVGEIPTLVEPVEVDDEVTDRDVEPPEGDAEPPENASGEAGMWEYSEAVVINDPGALWASRNPWLNAECAWDVAFLLLEDQQIITVRFVPFDNADQRHGVKCFDEGDNRQRWHELSQGTSNAHQVVYRAIVRRLPC